MLELLGSTTRNCDGIPRRDFVKVGALAAGGWTLVDQLRAEARAAQLFLRDRIVPFAEIRARIAAVTADDVRAIAAAAIAGPVAASAIGPKTGLGAAGAFRARFG
jgi:hypothetical protein